MEPRFATAAETADWNEKILANPDGGNVFQGTDFAEQKTLGGWKPRFVIAGDIALTILEKPVFGLGKLWYLPKGPGVTDTEQLAGLLPALRTFAAKNGAFAAKLEPELAKTDETVSTLKGLGLLPVHPIQPNFSTVTVDLAPSLDDVMKAFNQKGRHAIHRAERDGVTVRQAETTDENCKTFYDLLAQTATHQGFAGSIRAYEYYRAFWQRYADGGNGQLFFAEFDGKVVAGAFALVFGNKSTYKDGASVRVDGAYGVTHLLQWHVMQWAKERGSLLHDLCGAPPSDRIDDPTHPHYGIGRFKTSFNKQVTDYVGAYDVATKPWHYKLWAKFGERLAKRLWRQRHGDSWY